MPYNTNNPTGTNGSTDPRDLYDNAANLDLMATSQTLTVVPDRLGQPRTTLHGYDVKANAVIDSMGMYRLADQTFGGGTTITSNKQLLLWATEDGGTGFHYYWTAEISVGGKLVPPGSTPASTGGEGPGGWLAWDDLEQRLESGVAKVGDVPSKDVSLNVIANELIQYYSGLDDGTTDVSTAIEEARVKGVIEVRLPVFISGNYFIESLSAETFSGIRFQFDRNVNLSVDRTDLYSHVNNMAYQGDFSLTDRNIGRTNLVSPDSTLLANAVSLKKSRSVVKKLLSNKMYKARGTIGVDGLTEESWPDTAGQQLTMSGLSEGQFGVVAYPCEIGERLSFNWSNNLYSKGICVITKNEIYLAYQADADPTLTLYYKKQGSASVVGAGNTAVSSYKLNRSQISIVMTAANKARIHCNNVDLTTRFTPEIEMESEILYIGAVFASHGSSESASVKNYYTELDYEVATLPIQIGVYGDSLSQNYLNSWTSIAERILTQNGIHATVNNYAVAGENSSQQLARFTASGVGENQLLVVALGANNIQGASSISAYLSDLLQFVTDSRAAGRDAILAIPPMFMSRTMGGDTGYNTSNYDGGSDYRGSAIRLCQENAIHYFEMSSLSGYAENAQSTWWRDNIHQSSTGYLITGIQAAQAIFDYYRVGVSSVSRPIDLLVGTPWSGLPPRKNKDPMTGQVKLSGLFNIGGLTISDNSVIGSVGVQYAPSTDRYLPVATSYGASAHVLIGASTGNIVIFGLGTIPGAAWLSLDGTNYLI